MDEHAGTRPLPESFRMGDWIVEPALGALRRGEERRRIEPKAMEVLVLLATSAGQVLSKADITDAVWPLPFVSENRLTSVIADLRRALDDDAGEPRYVQTIPTRGYRLVAEVEWLDRPAHERSKPDSGFELQSPERDHRLREGVTVIGRSGECDLKVDSEWVSRRHARIVITNGSALLEDLGSKNGTHLNGAPVRGPVPLHDGDEIRLGRGACILRFATALLSTRTEVELDGRDS